MAPRKKHPMTRTLRFRVSEQAWEWFYREMLYDGDTEIVPVVRRLLREALQSRWKKRENDRAKDRRKEKREAKKLAAQQLAEAIHEKPKKALDREVDTARINEKEVSDESEGGSE